ncbi:MAG: DUF3575 domain-containing protein [Alistipes sp.]|jgi:outer membrane protein OmpA-like peptidoglycan-associated protein|nr:DUF3575 domain-containing protein [Alistipes sp.]
MKLRYLLLLSLVAVPMTLAAQTKKYDAYRAENGLSLPTWNIKTNLVADLTASMNLGFEFRTSDKTSLEIVGQWNPFSFRGGETEWRHWGFQPEFRYWLKEAFRSHFFGVQAHYAFYNVGGLPNGPFTDYMHNNRFQGDLYGAGVTWGHRWNFSQRWGLETTLGVGYVHKAYDIWECESCGKKLGEGDKNYFGPTEIGVNLIFGGGVKKTAVVPAPVPAPVAAAPAPAKVRYEPRLTPDYVTPAAEAVKVRAESGSAYLEYAVGRSDVVPAFRDNTAELERIHESIRSVRGDAEVTITGITLVGHASPEGSYTSNMSLSQRRAQNLRAYLNNIYDFSGSMITTRGEGEDWDTLGTLVEESNIEGKQNFLGIIRGSSDPDSRDRQMMAAGAESFSTIRTVMYPRLRRTDYRIDFEVAPISIERGKEVMRTNPRNLSLNELFLIADTYTPGSAEFREVMDIAARTFPDNDVANNNAAASALAAGDATRAAQLLGRVKNHDADWNNNMGMLSYLQGDAARAADYFRAAGQRGAANAAEMAKHLESIR